MKQFKYFWICCSSLFILSACSGFETKPYVFSSSSKEFVQEYCHAGKQTKALKTTVIYYSPDIEKGLPLDVANEKNKQIKDKKDELLKNLFYYLGAESMSEQIYNYGDEPGWYLLTAESENEILNNVKNEDANTKYRLYTFIVRVSGSNKLIIYQSNQSSRRMSYSTGYATDLNSLFSQYTLLTPKEVTEQITDNSFDSKFLYRTILLDENGNANISKAISGKDNLWKTYIKKFTLIKESEDDNSNKSNLELSLDLNVFCKYGRKISDLQSQ